MSRLTTMSRFEEPDNQPEAFECKKCGEIKPAREFKTDNSPMCEACEEAMNDKPPLNEAWDDMEDGARWDLLNKTDMQGLKKSNVVCHPWRMLSADVCERLERAYGY